MADDAPVTDETEEYERIPIPWFVKKKLMAHFLKQAHAYLFNVDGVRNTIGTQDIDALNAASAVVHGADSHKAHNEMKW